MHDIVKIGIKFLGILTALFIVSMAVVITAILTVHHIIIPITKYFGV